MYHVQRQLLIPADVPHTAVYAQNRVYCHPTGQRMIETVYNEARGESPRLGMRYYPHRLYRRESEDNGRTWSIQKPIQSLTPQTLEGFSWFTYQHFMDAKRDVLISTMIGQDFLASQDQKERFSDAGLTSARRRMYYQLSFDGGTTWTTHKPLVHEGDTYDEVHWGPGLHLGQNGGGADLSPWIQRGDGEIITTMSVNLEDGRRFCVVALHAHWNDAGDDLIWRWSDYVAVDATQSTQGCAEPAMVELPDGRLLMTLRCCGDREGHTFPSLKYKTISDDGGWNWSRPQPLTYDDGDMVWSPSSFHAMMRSSGSGRFYWIGNILPEPTYDSYPRQPLAIAELDPQTCCLRRETLGVIQALPSDAPPRRRYTNFGYYEDRFTGQLVLTLPEQPRTSWKDFTSDCIAYRIDLPS